MRDGATGRVAGDREQHSRRAEPDRDDAGRDVSIRGSATGTSEMSRQIAVLAATALRTAG